MDSFKLFIKRTTGDTLELKATSNDTIVSIKNKVKDKVKLSANDFNLYYKGIALDDKKTLGNYQVKDNDTLELVKKGEKRINILTLGSGAVGKTSILKRFESEEFKLSTNMTIGIDFVIKKVQIDKEDVKLKLWDTAGQDIYFSVSKSVYNKCQGALVVFGVNSSTSFSMVQKWINTIKENADSSIIIYLIGNKIDLPEREVSVEEAQQLAKSYNIPYYETSAKTGANVNDVLLRLAKEICSKRYGTTEAEGKKLTVASFKSGKRKHCCS